MSSVPPVSQAGAEPSAARSPPPAPATHPRQLSAAELDLFIRVGTPRDANGGDLIFHRGEQGRSMFVVQAGQVRLQFGDSVVDKLIGPGEFFGELALFIGNHARVANAIASEPSRLWVVGHDTFSALLDSEPRLLALFMQRSFAYLVASEQQLIANLRRRNEDLMVTLDSLRQTQTQLTTAQRLVQTDELTGLCNRRGLSIYLDQLQQRRVPDTLLGLLLIDVDHFKQINDRCGHLIGDSVLKAIADALREAAAACDMPCRLGGDEFAFLAQIASLDELRARADRIAASIRALRMPIGSETLRIAVSIGGGLCPSDGGWTAWYSEADTALYGVKGNGGDGINVKHMDAGRDSPAFC
ncbi:MAG TPA: GGDEF domain-containing protein [Dokdonella sp.]|uniref:GGDEF domain-containing protein n=1 Tax=Dokdonella sp. TaxID=2291710 RepID=UPI002C0E8B71|nr:GGDEF domain-containing protein [Dokdonella sp.]HUD43708.1 GGDEF domain-containing protein [Dokdonella sp.]